MKAVERGDSRAGAGLVRVLAVALALLCVAGAFHVGAQDRNVMIRTLRDGDDFRVRVQAAFAMGNTRDATYRPHLERALRDSNPAVRAAAATALGRLDDRRAVRALRRARRDSSAAVRMQVERSLRTLSEASEADVPSGSPRVRTGSGTYPAVTVMPSAADIVWPRVRYVVVMGDVSDRSNFRGAEPLLSTLRQEVRRSLRLLRGVAVFDSPEQVGSSDAREISRRRLPQLRLDGSLVNVDRNRARSEVSVRCEISLMLSTQPGRDLRGMLNGAATGSEVPRRDQNAQFLRLAEQALGAAVRSAMSTAPTALLAAANR